MKRIQKLVRYAYPRQRETYVYKRKLLGPDSLNVSIDLFKLRKIKLEKDKLRLTMENLDLEGHIETAGHVIEPPETANMRSALNSVSTLHYNQGMEQSTIETAYDDEQTQVDKSRQDLASQYGAIVTSAYRQLRSEEGFIDQLNAVKSHNLTQEQFLSPRDREKI